MTDGTNPGRRFIRDADRRVERLARESLTVPLGDIVSAQSVLADGTHSWAAYAAGGAVLSLPSVPNRQTVLMGPRVSGGALYTFEWDGATKMKAFTAGAEVAPATDLSAMANTPFLVVGRAGNEILVLSPGIRCDVYGLSIIVAASVAVSLTDYWTLRASLHRASGAVEKYGSYATNSSALYAGLTYDVFRTGEPLDLGEGDSLWLERVATGKPPYLSGALAEIDLRRKAG